MTLYDRMKQWVTRTFDLRPDAPKYLHHQEHIDTLFFARVYGVDKSEFEFNLCQRSDLDGEECQRASVEKYRAIPSRAFCDIAGVEVLDVYLCPICATQFTPDGTGFAMKAEIDFNAIDEGTKEGFTDHSLRDKFRNTGSRRQFER